MPRTVVTLSLDVDVVGEARIRAHKAHIPISTLHDLCMRYALTRLSEEALAKFAAERAPGGLGRLSKHERQVLGALADLEKKEAPAYRFMADEVAVTGGMLKRDAFRALAALKSRGMVASLDLEPGKFDSWGRPTREAWNRKDRSAK